MPITCCNIRTSAVAHRMYQGFHTILTINSDCKSLNTINRLVFVMRRSLFPLRGAEFLNAGMV
jgi:hypothetical protein